MRAIEVIADLTTKAEAARKLGVEKYVIHVAAHMEGIPLHRHPVNGMAQCFDPAGMARLVPAVEVYKRNRALSEPTYA